MKILPLKNDEFGTTRFAQPLPPDRDANAARAAGSEPDSEAILNKAAGRENPKWHMYPELYAAGLWTTASDLARELPFLQKTQ